MLLPPPTGSWQGRVPKAALAAAPRQLCCRPTQGGPTGLRPTNESRQETQEVEEEALWSAPWGETRELTTSASKERKGGENKQWRKPACGLTIGWGCGGSNASPTWRKGASAP